MSWNGPAAFRITLLATAIGMLALMLIPGSVWQHPATDVTYSGFDPNLMPVTTKANPASRDGIVEFSGASARLTAIPSSDPSFHLLTTPMPRFEASMDIVVLEGAQSTMPLQIGIWGPRSGAGYFLIFGPDPSDLIMAQVLRNGTPGPTLQGAQVLSSKIVGAYHPGESYHLDVTLDKQAGIISYRLSGVREPPTHDPMFALAGGPADPRYSDIVSDPVGVKAGEPYSFGGLASLVSGADAYKIGVAWFDKHMRPVGTSNDWRSIAELSGWSQERFSDRAPAQAAFARLELGSGNGTFLLFTDLYFRRETAPTVNQLTNGRLLVGPAGWSLSAAPSKTPQTINPSPGPFSTGLRAADAPELFGDLRLSLTASAASSAGVSSVELRNYRLSLPHTKFWADKTDDPRATWLVILLLLLGMALLVTKCLAWIVQTRKGQSLELEYVGQRLNQRLGWPRWAALAAGLIVVGVVIPNVLLFGLGQEPFDMGAQNIWAYIAAKFGPAQLYFLPNVVSQAHVWAGAPYHETVFPYEPALAYVFTAIGGLQAILGSQSTIWNTMQAETLIKAVNLLFGLADGLLIYLILRRSGHGQRVAVIGSGLFLLNPAVWFSMSVLGVTHVITISLLLAAVYFFESRQPIPAWAALAAAVLCRPQVLVVCLVLGLLLLRRFSVADNVRALSWVVVLVFVTLAPLMLATGPSLPVDVMAKTLQVQEGGGNEAELTTVSLNAYSVWPLVTYLVGGQSGENRAFLPSAQPLIGGLSYQRVSQILTIVLILAVALLALSDRSQRAGPGGYLPLLALAMTGFLMLITGLAATHFLLGLPFLILCRRWLPTATFYFIVGVWTLTTLVPMWGGMGIGLSQPGYLGFPLSSASPITRFFMDLSSWDRFITLATLLNVIVLATVVLATWSTAVRVWVPELHRSDDQQVPLGKLLRVQAPVQEVICAECRQVNDATRHFCRSCGAVMRDPAGSASPR